MDTTRPLPERVADELRAEMGRQLVTTRHLAESTAIPRSSLHRKLTSKGGDFSLGELVRVCHSLGVSVSEMTERAERAAA